MKRVFDEYFHIILYAIMGIILVMSSYVIIINVHHYKALSQELVVSEADTYYNDYKKNINLIETYLNSHSSDKKDFISLKNTLNVLKNGGVFRLMVNTKIKYHDLYTLNDYFMNDIINNCWIANLKELNNNKANDEMVDILINNSKYLNNSFINNGTILYDSVDENKLENDYMMILKNYLSFSNVILSMAQNIGG